jgi:hypothetical protein
VGAGKSQQQAIYRVVTHSGTNHTELCLTSVNQWELEHSIPYHQSQNAYIKYFD